MSFFDLLKLPVKYALRTASNKQYRKDESAAKSIAYSRTGEKIAKAKNKGYRIDGSATYKRELKNQLNVAQDRKQARDKTIDDI